MTDFAAFVDRYMNDQRTRNEFHEWKAMELLKTSGLLEEIAWENLRRGNPQVGEPDWVIVNQSGAIVKGFEVTKLSFESMAQTVGFRKRMPC